MTMHQAADEKSKEIDTALSMDVDAVDIDPEELELLLGIEENAEKVYIASNWQLIWWKYRKHRVAVASTFIVVIFYLIAAFCEFVAPYDPEQNLLIQAPSTDAHPYHRC